MDFVQITIIEAPEPSDPPRLPYGDIIIKFLLGTGTRLYQVSLHENLVCATSKFFRVALAGPWLEA